MTEKKGECYLNSYKSRIYVYLYGSSLLEKVKLSFLNKECAYERPTQDDGKETK